MGTTSVVSRLMGRPQEHYPGGPSHQEQLAQTLIVCLLKTHFFTPIQILGDRVDPPEIYVTMAQRWELMGMSFESNILFLFREGLVSCVGYTAIYFAGVSWGEVVFAPKSARKESLAELKSIGRISI